MRFYYSVLHTKRSVGKYTRVNQEPKNLVDGKPFFDEADGKTAGTKSILATDDSLVRRDARTVCRNTGAVFSVFGDQIVSCGRSLQTPAFTFQQHHSPVYRFCFFFLFSSDFTGSGDDGGARTSLSFARVFRPPSGRRVRVSCAPPEPPRVVSCGRSDAR